MFLFCVVVVVMFFFFLFEVLVLFLVFVYLCMFYVIGIKLGNDFEIGVFCLIFLFVGCLVVIYIVFLVGYW